ncbi:MAG TPA: mechanosensitive ion channel domain-containing protein [Candidatus Eisenbacteria bacterium]|nr:mechanosensitive ion channel domain-containing protein [Candidatus Eisenbacteria bacterium]
MSWYFLIALFLAAPAVSHPNSAGATLDSVPEAIPLAEVAGDAESAIARAEDLGREAMSQRFADDVLEQLPPLARQIEARMRETRKIIAHRPSAEMLDALERSWWHLGRVLYGWTWSLTRGVGELEEQKEDLANLASWWDRTLESAHQSDAPAELVRRIEEVRSEIRRAIHAVDARRSRFLTAQNRVAAQEARIADAFRSISEAREQFLKRLFVRDGAVWAVADTYAPLDHLLEQTGNSLAIQWAGVRSYGAREGGLLFFHGVLFAAALALLLAAKSVLRLAASDAIVERAARVLKAPLAGALLLSATLGWWLYLEAPRLWTACVGMVALTTAVLILNTVVDRRLRPLLYVSIALYALDHARVLLAAVAAIPRVLFTAEMAGALLLALWFVHTLRVGSLLPGPSLLARTVRAAAVLASAAVALALAADLFGYVTFSVFLGTAVVRSAVMAVILGALLEIVDGAATLMLVSRPVARLAAVQRYGPLLSRRIRRTVQWIAVVLWTLYLLDRLLVRERLFRFAADLWSAEAAAGALRLSLGNLVLFALTVWAAFLVSRFLRFLLEEDVYPRVRLSRGLPYAISTLLHYGILTSGFFVAVGALGFDMTKVTILAGAFTLGVGFGLQNIFNNFVSGIILLFERPVKVGDIVQIEDASGIVERIGIRASIIRTANGSDIIVPNGKLISERVINWTLSNRQHSIELPVTVAPEHDPPRLIELLERTAAAHPLISRDPPPKAFVVRLGPNSLGLEVRAWTDHIEKWIEIRSELAIRISAALATEKIAMR